MDLPGESIVGGATPRVNAAVQTAASAFVALVCAASAGVHAALVPDHYREGGLVLGGAFAVSALLLGASALLASRRAAHDLVVVVLLGTAVAYLLSRTTGIPLLIPDPEGPDALGLVTTVSEAVAAVVAALLLHTREEDR